MSDDKLLTRYRAALESLFGDRLERAVLFGSRARGDAGADSDYDRDRALKPETARFAEQADVMLARADVMLTAGLPEDAARTSYLANFHMAQDLVFERTGRITETHRGVQAEFTRLTRDEPTIQGEIRATLSRSYDFKAFADYFSGPVTSVSTEEAAEAIGNARRFVEKLSELLGDQADDH